MREPDHQDVDVVLRLYELRRETEMRKGRAFLTGFAPKTIDELLAVYAWEHPENAHFRQVTSYWEMAADFCLRGLLHQEMFVAHCGEAFVIYARLGMYVDEMRSRGFSRFLANMTACIAKYPACAERLRVIQEMLAAREKLTASQAKKAPSKAPAEAKRPAKARPAAK
jgi:hypothetical protein